jgi:hypothetical protein
MLYHKTWNPFPQFCGVICLFVVLGARIRWEIRKLAEENFICVPQNVDSFLAGTVDSRFDEGILGDKLEWTQRGTSTLVMEGSLGCAAKIG